MAKKTIAALGLATAVALFAGSAKAQLVDVSNANVYCNTILKGSLKISPALINGGGSPTVYKVKGKLGSCQSNAGITIPDYKSSFKGVLNVDTNDCGALLGGGSTTGTITIKWKADEKITPATSTVTIGPSSVSNTVFSAPWGGPYGEFRLGMPYASPVSVTDAFTGGDGGANSYSDIISTQDLFVILNQCATTGVKVLNIGLGYIQLG